MTTLLRTRLRPIAASAAVLGLLAGAACADDDKPAALSSDYCDAVIKVAHHDSGMRGETDAATIRPAYARVLDALAAPLQRIEDEGDADARAAAETLVATYEAARDDGTDPFDAETGALSEMVRASRTGCAWPVTVFEATDYHFGLPERVEAGTASLRLDNASDAEPHLLLFARVKDGVTKPLDALLPQFLGQDTAPDAEIEYVPGGVFALPKQTTYGVAKFRAGRYIYLCPLPVNGGASPGEDHATRGMQGEFVVS